MHSCAHEVSVSGLCLGGFYEFLQMSLVGEEECLRELSLTFAGFLKLQILKIKLLK